MYDMDMDIVERIDERGARVDWGRQDRRLLGSLN